jgi:hypothetical protein
LTSGPVSQPMGPFMEALAMDRLSRREAYSGGPSSLSN